MPIKKVMAGVQVAGLCFPQEQTEKPYKIQQNTPVWSTESCWNNQDAKAHGSEWRRTSELGVKSHAPILGAGPGLRVGAEGPGRRLPPAGRETSRAGVSSWDHRGQNHRPEWSDSWWEVKTEKRVWQSLVLLSRHLLGSGASWGRKPPKSWRGLCGHLFLVLRKLRADRVQDLSEARAPS